MQKIWKWIAFVFVEWEKALDILNKKSSFYMVIDCFFICC